MKKHIFLVAVLIGLITSIIPTAQAAWGDDFLWFIKKAPQITPIPTVSPITETPDLSLLVSENTIITETPLVESPVVKEIVKTVIIENSEQLTEIERLRKEVEQWKSLYNETIESYGKAVSKVESLNSAYTNAVSYIRKYDNLTKELQTSLEESYDLLNVCTADSGSAQTYAAPQYQIPATDNIIKYWGTVPITENQVYDPVKNPGSPIPPPRNSVSKEVFCAKYTHGSPYYSSEDRDYCVGPKVPRGKMGQ